jgi:hypothetical protein
MLNLFKCSNCKTITDDEYFFCPYCGIKFNNKKQDQENHIHNTQNNSDVTIFDGFRKKYPGTKRGLQTEFKNFCSKHNDWKLVLPILSQSLNNQISWKRELFNAKMFVPCWAHLQTWINQRRWEEEKPIIKYNDKNSIAQDNNAIDQIKKHNEEMKLHPEEYGPPDFDLTALINGIGKKI